MDEIPDKLESPAAALTAWQKLEAIEARLTAKWDHPSLIASGLCVPNLRENILRILGIPTDGEGRPLETLPPPDPVDPLDRFRGIPLSKSQLTASVQKLLVAEEVTTLYYLMILSPYEADAITGIGPVTVGKIEAEKARLLADPQFA